MSPAKFKAVVRELDQDGKLDYIFGKKGAQEIRDLLETTILVNAPVKGAVNTSNSASAIIRAMDKIKSSPLGRIPGVGAVTEYGTKQGVKKQVEEALNFDANAVASGDLIQAIGGKLALLTRTADGGNLMPGAMSDFEQNILRQLSPGLKQSADGRIALTNFLSSMADMRIRLAEEANKMAAANRGILPSNWYERRDRILREERARMTLEARKLSQQFGGK